MSPLSFIIIGSGWRSLFYVRIAKRFPHIFSLKYMLCRTHEKAYTMAQKYGVPTTTSEEVCEQAAPDFVVIAVTKGGLFGEIKKWSDKGFPILSETPAGVNIAELKEIWNMTRAGAKIQIAEQYHRYPFIAAGLKVIKEGKIGEPQSVNLSVAHDYHGISLIRRMLQPENHMDLRLKYLHGEQYVFPVTETDSRIGIITNGEVKDRTRVVITMHFTNGKIAHYDFDKVQYHSFIRARHLNVRGKDGEWNDTMLRYVDQNHHSKVEKIIPYMAPEYAPIAMQEIRKGSIEWDHVQDEYAMATVMFDMREYIMNGIEVYPLAEALEDEYLWILFQEAVKRPQERIVPEVMPWQ